MKFLENQGRVLRGEAQLTASNAIESSSKLSPEVHPLNPTVWEALVTLTKAVLIKGADVEGRGHLVDEGLEWEGGSRHLCLHGKFYYKREKRGEVGKIFFLWWLGHAEMSRDNGMGMELVVETATWSAGWRGDNWFCKVPKGVRMIGSRA